MPLDIIDNQSIKLADSIRSMPPRSAAAHFAAGCVGRSIRAMAG